MKSKKNNYTMTITVDGKESPEFNLEQLKQLTKFIKTPEAKKVVEEIYKKTKAEGRG